MQSSVCRFRALAVAILAASSLAACGGDPVADMAANGARPEPFLIALARTDGAVVPFAQFDGVHWTTAPSAPGSTGEPATIADRAEAWFADSPHSRDSWRVVTPMRVWRQEPRAAETQGDPVELDSHCQRVWGLQATVEAAAKASTPAAGEIGVAFTGDHDVLSVAEMDVNLDENRRAVAFLPPHFVAAEVRQAQRRADAGANSSRPIGAGAANSPLSLSRLHYVGRRAESWLYAFEAARTYPAAAGTPDAGCENATVMTGWLAERQEGGFTLLGSEIALTDCHRKETTAIEPLVAVELGGRLFVITVDHRFESESYSIWDVGPGAARRVLTVRGGSCQGPRLGAFFVAPAFEER